MSGGTPVCADIPQDIRNKVLYEWNDTSSPYPHVCVHQLFEEQVAQRPDAIAVVGAARALTYGELNEQANQLAHHLRKLGVGPDSLVGVCMGRSSEMAVALLSVWKAGGAYVPIDPSYPQDRLQFMVSDAAVKVLITEERLRESFGGHDAVCLDTDWNTICLYPKNNLDLGNNLSNLAYVMYTSGSTGKPKGAMITHRGLVNYLTWAIREYHLEPGLSVPVHSSISFDLTVTSLYPALLSGGTVEMLPEDVGAGNLVAALRRQSDRNLVKITPAHLEVLSQQLNPRELAGLTRLFVIGGENLPAESLQIWREKAPGTRLINEYGPTETVVGCCVYEVTADDPHNGPVAIGRPIANTQMYILDEGLHPAAPGVTGEIYIGGHGVARGYLNRPELTAERFLKDPFIPEPDARMYKTGDLGRYREDGIIEYLGRVDNQVKVRGYRIELGEIEAAISAWSDTQSCAVLAREDLPGLKELVAYIVPRNGYRAAKGELQRFLADKLPAYMVPARYAFLKSLPLTPNGKVDRKALPAPEDETLDFEPAEARPNAAIEERLAAIWSELLNVQNVGVDDDFFDLGGRSRQALNVVSRARDLFSVDLPPQTIFESSTIEAFARAIAASAASQADSETLQPVRRYQRVSDPSPPAISHAENYADTGALIQHHASAETSHSYAGPRDSVEQVLTQIWSRILRVKKISINDNFFELGGHSLLAVRLITEIEKFCHVRLPLATLFQTPTIAEFSEVLRKENWTPSWSSLVPICTSGSRPALFLMHSHGGNTLEYHTLAHLLQPDQPVYSLQTLGLDGRIHADSTVEQMAASYIEEIQSIQARGPYFLGGFCLGGLIALEAAHQLTEAGHEVGSLSIIQSMHPSAMVFRSDVSSIQKFWYSTAKRASLEMQNLSTNGINYLFDRVQYAFHRAYSRSVLRLRKTKLEGDADLSQLSKRHILEALAMVHTKAMSKYMPPCYDGRVLLIRAGTQLRGLQLDEYLGWKKVLTGELRVVEIPGHQQNLLLQPHVAQLAAALKAELEDVVHATSLPLPA